MGRLGVDDLLRYDASRVSQMSREEAIALALQALDLARRLANQVDGDSSNSSRPPSSDSPYKGQTIEQALDVLTNPASTPDVTTGSAASKTAGGSKDSTAAKPKRPGKQPGMKGFWRSQPIVANVPIDHVAPLYASCGASLTGPDLPRRCVGAHHVLDLERDPGTLAKSGPRSTAILPSPAAAGPRRWSGPARGLAPAMRAANATYG